MTLKMSQVLGAAGIYSKIKDCQPPIKLLYKLTKLFKAINENQEFYREQLNEIINTYGIRDENGQLKPTSDGNGVQIEHDKIDEAQDKINALIGLEVELPDVTFTLDELESLTCTLEEFQYLLPFIQD